MARKNNRVEVSNITPEGCDLHIYAERYFADKGYVSANGENVSSKIMHLSFEKFPHFFGVSGEAIQQVTLTYSHLSWEALDIDLGIECLECDEYNDDEFLIFTREQLKRLNRYNKEQAKKNGKQWNSELVAETWAAMGRRSGVGIWHSDLKPKRKRNTDKIRVTDITSEGCWLHIYAKNYFSAIGRNEFSKKYYLSFKKFPHFLGASKTEIKGVTLKYDYLHWESLSDFYLEIMDLETPLEEYRHEELSFSQEQTKRLKDYNEKQIAKGDTPWRPDLVDKYLKRVEWYGHIHLVRKSKRFILPTEKVTATNRNRQANGGQK